MKTSLCLGLLTALTLTGCGDKSTKPAQTTNAAAASSSPLTAPVDYLGALDKAQKTAGKVVDTASINQAIQMFQVDKGRNPKNLQELVDEKILPRIPEPPYGYKIVYDANAGTVQVVKQ